MQPLESALLSGIFVKLLGALPPRRRVSYADWPDRLRSELDRREQAELFPAGTAFPDLAADAKVTTKRRTVHCAPHALHADAVAAQEAIERICAPRCR